MIIERRQLQMVTEWKIMQIILRNWCGADTQKIIADLVDLNVEKEWVFECIARLKETGVLSLSLEHGDFIFSPDAAISPLVKALKTKKVPPIPVEEWSSHGWRKLARLPFDEQPQLPH